MKVEDSMIVASVLVGGMTEKDLFNSKKILLQFLPILDLQPLDEDVLYTIKTHLRNDYAVMSIFIDAEYWEAYTENHDSVEFSLVTAQKAIWEEVH